MPGATELRFFPERSSDVLPLVTFVPLGLKSASRSTIDGEIRRSFLVFDATKYRRRYTAEAVDAVLDDQSSADDEEDELFALLARDH